MALKDFSTINSDQREVSKLQDNLTLYLKQLNPQLLDGAILKGISLSAASTTEIPHGLGRAFQGWIILDQDGSAIIWRDAGSTSDSKRFLPLKTSADVNVKLWVY